LRRLKTSICRRRLAYALGRDSFSIVSSVIHHSRCLSSRGLLFTTADTKLALPHSDSERVILVLSMVFIPLPKQYSTLEVFRRRCIEEGRPLSTCITSWVVRSMICERTSCAGIHDIRAFRRLLTADILVFDRSLTIVSH
jgi:hypothetical protein